MSLCVGLRLICSYVTLVIKVEPIRWTVKCIALQLVYHETCGADVCLDSSVEASGSRSESIACDSSSCKALAALRAVVSISKALCIFSSACTHQQSYVLPACKSRDANVVAWELPLNVGCKLCRDETIILALFVPLHARYLRRSSFESRAPSRQTQESTSEVTSNTWAG